MKVTKKKKYLKIQNNNYWQSLLYKEGERELQEKQEITRVTRKLPESYQKVNRKLTES
jgi:hypothetical protein